MDGLRRFDQRYLRWTSRTTLRDSDAIQWPPGVPLALYIFPFKKYPTLLVGVRPNVPSTLFAWFVVSSLVRVAVLPPPSSLPPLGMGMHGVLGSHSVEISSVMIVHCPVQN